MFYIIIIFVFYYIYKNDLHNKIEWPNYKELAID